MSAAVDSNEVVRALGKAAHSAGSEVHALVDVDVGLEGRVRANEADRARTIARAYEVLAATRDAVERSGLPIRVVSSAGTSPRRGSSSRQASVTLRKRADLASDVRLRGLNLDRVRVLSPARRSALRRRPSEAGDHPLVALGAPARGYV